MSAQDQHGWWNYCGHRLADGEPCGRWCFIVPAAGRVKRFEPDQETVHKHREVS